MFAELMGIRTCNMHGCSRFGIEKKAKQKKKKKKKDHDEVEYRLVMEPINRIYHYFLVLSMCSRTSLSISGDVQQY